MENFDLDLRSIQEARNLARQGEEAAKKMATYTSEQIDKILKSMVEAVSYTHLVLRIRLLLPCIKRRRRLQPRL